MKRAMAWMGTEALGIALLIGGCGPTTGVNEQQQDSVLAQQDTYPKYQPPPFFNWSLQRQLWIDFYKATNSQVATYSVITAQGTGATIFETPFQGMPIPYDTQLTNTLQVSWRYNYGDGVIEQPEPNGLYTGKNTDATIIMATNPDGTLAPIYTEQKVTCFPFPVRRRADGSFERVDPNASTIKLKVEKGSEFGNAPPPPAENPKQHQLPAVSDVIIYRVCPARRADPAVFLGQTVAATTGTFNWTKN